MRADEFHQVMLDRQREVEEAVERAERGEATTEDWKLIRYECGLRSQNANSASNTSQHLQTRTTGVTLGKVLPYHRPWNPEDNLSG